MMMVYNTTGRSHKEGVKNELKVENYLNKLILKDPDLIKSTFDLDSLNNITFRHLGGTAHKSDLDILNMVDNSLVKDISIKKFNVGSTFDLVNTTKIDEYLTDEARENFLPLNDYINKMQGKYKNQELSDEFKSEKKMEVKGKIETLTNSFLSSLKDHEIRGIIERVNSKDCDYLLITKFAIGSSGSKNDFIDYSIIKKENRYDYSTHLSAKTLSLKEGRGLTSKQILVDGELEGMRLRVVLNNGINALLGFNWKSPLKNQSSALTFKIQQDDPQKLIDLSKNVKFIK